MGLFDSLFISKNEAEATKKSEWRKAVRGLESSLEGISERINILYKEQNEHWNKAKEAMKRGQTTEAQRYLRAYETKGRSKQRLENFQMLFQEKLDNLEMTKELTKTTQAMVDLMKLLNISPEQVAETLDTINAKNSEINDSLKVLDKEAMRFFARDENSPSAPNCNSELFESLENEVSAEIQGGAPVSEEKANSPSDSDISEGLEKLHKAAEK